MAISTAALAQVPPAQLQAVPQGSPLPRVLPPSPPTVTPAPLTLPSAAPGTTVPNQAVTVSAVTVDGVTVYPTQTILALTDELRGQAVPLSRIDAVRQAILQRYRADGYVLCTVSANLDAQTGQLRFVVAEGRIASVKLDGDIGPAGTQVLRFLNRLTEPPAINAATLERYLLLAQDVPGVTLHAVLQPNADAPGTLTLVAQVSRQAVSGLASVDNRAWRNSGPIEALVVADFNSFTSYGEKSEVSLYHTFPNSQTFGQAAIETFLGSSGLKLRVYGGAGTTVPTGPLAQQNYNGTTNVFGAQLSYPLIRARQQTLNLFADFDGTESDVDLGTPSSQFGYDSVRAVRLGATYALSDLLLGNDRSAITAVSARLSQGLDILGATADGASNAPRLGERTDFTKLDFQLSRTQTLFTPWHDASVALMGLLAGQYSGDILPPSEQFYLGGSQYTRGYYAGEVIGDKALVATLELQLNTTIDLSHLGLPGEIPTQFYTFYDWGEVWSNLASDFSTHLSSAGGGARIQLTRWAELDLEGAARFNRYPTGTGSGVSALYGGAFYWRVVFHY